MSIVFYVLPCKNEDNFNCLIYFVVACSRSFEYYLNQLHQYALTNSIFIIISYHKKLETKLSEQT